MTTQYYWLALVLVGGMVLSIKARKLTPAAAITGGLLGWFIFMGAGFTGIAMMAAFFLLGTLATSFKKRYKENAGLSESGSSRRNGVQVIANAGVAAACGLTGWLYKEDIATCRLLMAAAFASATADTLSSELGNVWGRRFYNVLTLRKDARGLDGVVSMEGTTAGIAGSMVIATVYGTGFGFAITTFIIIVAAGAIGNMADSYLGASLERKHYLNNDAVNFFNTLIAAIAAYLFYRLFL